MATLMTLDEAIKHYEEVAEEKERQVKEGAWEKDSNTEKQCNECAKEHRQLAEWLKELKMLRTEHKTRWIPVSERLPEEGEDVLVYVKGYDSCGHYEDEPCYAPDGSIHISGECKHGECDKCKWNLARHFFYCEVATHFNEPTSFSSDGWLRISEEDEVIAWMPLPKPYQSND